MSATRLRAASLAAAWVCLLFISAARSEEAHADQDEIEQRISACLAAYAELLPIVPDYRWANDDLVRRHPDLFERYDAACQQGLDGLRHDATRAYLRARLGAIFESADSTIPFCTAFRLTDRRLATAEHCFWKAGKRRDETKLRFSLLDAPEERLSFTVLSEHPASEGQIADKTDVAILELREDSALPTLGTGNRFDLDVPTDLCGDAYILIPGVFRPALVARDDLGLGDWVEAVRMDGTQTCVRRSGAFETQCISKDSLKASVVSLFYGEQSFKNDLCIVSNCQTYPGMSGSPIIGFDQQENTLFAEGVFVRSGAAAPNRGNTCGDLMGLNVGVSFPDAVLAILNGE